MSRSHDRPSNSWAQTADRFAQDVRTLAPPTGLFWIGPLVNKFRWNKIHHIAMVLWQGLEVVPPTAQHRESLVHGDAYQPSGKQRLFLKIIEMNECFLKALLRHILGIFAVIG